MRNTVIALGFSHWGTSGMKIQRNKWSWGNNLWGSLSRAIMGRRLYDGFRTFPSLYHPCTCSSRPLRDQWLVVAVRGFWHGPACLRPGACRKIYWITFVFKRIPIPWRPYWHLVFPFRGDCPWESGLLRVCFACVDGIRDRFPCAYGRRSSRKTRSKKHFPFPLEKPSLCCLDQRPHFVDWHCGCLCLCFSGANPRGGRSEERRVG